MAEPQAQPEQEQIDLTPEQEQHYWKTGGELPDEGVEETVAEEKAPVDSAVGTGPTSVDDAGPAPVAVSVEEPPADVVDRSQYDDIRQAMDRYRAESREARSEAQELRERLARLEGQRSTLDQLFPAEQEDEDPVKKTAAELTAERAAREKLEQRLNDMSMAQNLMYQEQQFAAQHPDYGPAKDYLIAKKLEYYKLLGNDATQAQVAWQQELAGKINEHIAAGRDPIAAFYAEAQLMGFQPQAPKKAAAAERKLTAVAQGQQPSMSSVPAGQGADKPRLTPEMVADLSDDELSAMSFQDWARIVRGE